MKNILRFGALVFLASSCYYDNKEELYQHSDTGCDTVDISFKSTIVPILEANCYRCHSGATPTFSLDLSSYTDVKRVADNGALVGRLKGTIIPQMPYGSSPLPDCQIAQIEAWVNDGAPNN